MGIFDNKISSFTIKYSNEEELNKIEKVIDFLFANKNNNEIEIPRIIDCMENDHKEIIIFIENILN